KGLMDRFCQMAYLKREIDKGNYKELVKSYGTTKHPIHLTFDKHLLKDFFTAVVDSSSSLKFIHIPTDAKKVVHSSDSVFGMNRPVKKEEIIKIIYPNPT